MMPASRSMSSTRSEPGSVRCDGAELLVLLVGLGIVDQLAHDGVDLPVEVGAVLGGAGDDQRRARLVDQDAVHLVDDGVGEVALDHVLQPVLHVVAQVVEAELVVGAVGDVGGVGGAALARRPARAR